MTRVTVTDAPGRPPGHALIRLSGLPAGTARGLEIERESPTLPHLGPEGWRATGTVLTPLDSQASAEGVDLVVGPDIVRHLALGMTLRLRVHMDDGAREVALAWPTIAPPPPDDAHSRGRLRPRAQPEPPPPPPPPPMTAAPPPPPPPGDEELAEADEVITAEQAPPPPPGGTPAPHKARRLPWPFMVVIGGVLVLAALAFAGVMFMDGEEDGEVAELEQAPLTPEPPPEPELSPREQIRRLLATEPPAPAIMAKAAEMTAQGHGDLAFLLHLRAAEKGSVAGALAAGRAYDPRDFDIATRPLPAPNAAEAERWYRQAAEAGNAEAQRRLGRLMLDGHAGTPEEGQQWLDKAGPEAR